MNNVTLVATTECCYPMEKNEKKPPQFFFLIFYTYVFPAQVMRTKEYFLHLPRLLEITRLGSLIGENTTRLNLVYCSSFSNDLGAKSASGRSGRHRRDGGLPHRGPPPRHLLLGVRQRHGAAHQEIRHQYRRKLLQVLINT